MIPPLMEGSAGMTERAMAGGRTCPRCGSAMVQRRARRGNKAGGFFWGCSRYPACQAIVDIPLIAASPDPEADAAFPTPGSMEDLGARLSSGGAVIGTPGGSARRTYERRRANDDARRADRFAPALFRAAFAGTLVYAMTALTWGSSLAGVLAVSVALVITLKAILPRQSTIAWATGAEGEEATARVLDPLAHDGYVIFHDRKIPFSPANIDHLVIGPTGVFVIETKNIAGDLRVSGSEVRIAGRRIAVVDEVQRELDATWNAVGPLLGPRGLSITPLVCVHRAKLPFLRRSVTGIRIVSGRGLARSIRRQPVVLDANDIDALRQAVQRTLPGTG